jgi:hypothetical protein
MKKHSVSLGWRREEETLPNVDPLDAISDEE